MKMKQIFSDVTELERYGFRVKKCGSKIHIKSKKEEFYVEPNVLVFDGFKIPFERIRFGVVPQNRVFVEVFFDKENKFPATLYLIR